MKFFTEIKRIFRIDNINIVERLDTVEASFTIKFKELPNVETLHSLCNIVPERDNLKFKIINDSNDIVSITNNQNELSDFSTLTSNLELDDYLEIKVEIDKHVSDGKLSIYDFDSFSNDLIARSTPEILNWFSKCLSGKTSLKFEVYDYDISFSTRTMAFESSENAIFDPKIDRNQRLKSCRETACFYNMNTFEVIPDDFIIEGVIRSGEFLKPLFGKLATILSICYIASSALMSDESVNVQINGQRITSHDLLLNDIQEDENWQNIYTWIFTDGNSTDKALIAHNIISLHCKFEAFLKIDKTVFEAIRTNYKLYLRNNVDKYLNLKQDIAEFIQNVVCQTGDYAIAILGKFKANLIAIFGFLFTVVLTKIGVTQKWNEIFTRHTVYIIELFLMGSLVYLGICFCETRFKLKKIKQGYNELKNNYQGLLSTVEINEAFGNDNLMTSTEHSVNKGTIWWSIIWGLLLLAPIVIIELFTHNQGIIIWLLNKIIYY